MAQAGYIWLDQNYFYYIDEYGTKRRIELASIGGEGSGHTTGFPYRFTFFFDGEGI